MPSPAPRAIVHHRKLEAERQKLKEQALAKVQEAIAELGEMGLIYELRERKKKIKKQER